MNPAERIIDLQGKRVLVFIVAYNAETTIEKVLSRIPASLAHAPMSRCSSSTIRRRTGRFRTACGFSRRPSAFKITILRTPRNQGYGGNQKLGYRYAIDHGFDIVALVHGDGQYAPEKLPDLLQPLVRQEADAVFGSRMIDKKAARAGGMPAYKWIRQPGPDAISKSRCSDTALSEFHSGYRLYSTAALAQMPFEKNTNDFHFDTEIIIQFVLKKLRIAELPIPTFYGDEICHVNGMKYAWDVFEATCKARLCGIHLFYDRKFDVNPGEPPHSDKLDFPSSQSFAAEACAPGDFVLQLGLGHANVAAELMGRLCHVTAIDFTSNDLAEASLAAPAVPMPHLPRKIGFYDKFCSWI